MGLDFLFLFSKKAITSAQPTALGIHKGREEYNPQNALGKQHLHIYWERAPLYTGNCSSPSLQLITAPVYPSSFLEEKGAFLYSDQSRPFLRDRKLLRPALLSRQTPTCFRFRELQQPTSMLTEV